MSDLKSAISAADDLKRRAVPTPEWPTADGKLYVRQMSGAERAAWARSTVVMGDDGEVVRNLDAISTAAVRLAQLTLVDESGNRIFSDSAEDFALLASKNADAIERIAEAASELNALTDDALEQAEEDLGETPVSDT